MILSDREYINPKDYHYAVNLLRSFFEDLGFIEVPTQSRLSILAACEDPRTIATYNYSGQVWPLPQTGQMWLEYELLNHPEAKGFYCHTTSFRNEPHPIEGRHDLVFPMFEFETHGDMQDLQDLETDLLDYLGFSQEVGQQLQGFVGYPLYEPMKLGYPEGDYDEICKEFDTSELKAEHEEKIYEKYGPVFFLKNFPQTTSPFWNMKKVGDHANKIDVILYGIETIGSAERSTDPDEMEHLFHTISNGMYADILYSQFGKDRVEAELMVFLGHNFFPRIGGGIGMTRFIRAMKMLKGQE